MAWQGEVNKNIEESWAASAMFYTKKALLDAGWDLMSAGGGGREPGKGALNTTLGIGQPGLLNTGSGGGGGIHSSNTSQQRASGAGGSGIVVVRYPTSSSIVATGGAITQITQEDTEYRIHRFVGSEDLVVSSGSGDMEYLIVGGGGGGGHRGGGNGGGIQQGTVNVSTGTYPVVVGAGGAGIPGGATNMVGNPGIASSVLGLTASGGAGGAALFAGPTGGAGPGGDGAGGTGSYTSTSTQGGDGLLLTITGFNVYYAAGGGGGAFITDFNNFGGLQGALAVNLDSSPLDPGQDPLTGPVACNVPNAWFRIREPAKPDPNDLPREFVFLKGVLGNNLLIKYSRASGFTGGGFINVAPTTGASGDGVVVSSMTGSDATATNGSSATAFDVSVNSSNKINVVVSDFPVFGVFPFYIWSYRNGSGSCDCALLHEGVLPGTTSALDQDPTYRVMASGATGLGFLNAIAGTVGDYWEAYGLPNAVHRRGNLGYATAWGTNQAPDTTNQNASRVFPPENILGPSRYSGNPVTAPTLVGIGGQFPKGFSTGVVFGGFTAQNVLDTFNLGSSNPRIVAHYPNAREAIFLPWVPNIVPQV